MKVKDLMDCDLGLWNRDLIFNCFDPSEALKIVRILISIRNMEDSLIWLFECYGEYLVRTTYHLSMQQTLTHRLGPSSQAHKQVWKEI